jgi:hypothetical protein
MLITCLSCGVLRLSFPADFFRANAMDQVVGVRAGICHSGMAVLGAWGYNRNSNNNNNEKEVLL